MRSFFSVKSVIEVLKLVDEFETLDEEIIDFSMGLNRVLAEDICSEVNIPNFSRSTMDGYAIKALSSFGCSEQNPVYLNVVGDVKIGEMTNIKVEREEVVKIPTGGAIPNGTDSVMMLEYTSKVDAYSIEAYKSVTPGENVIFRGDDVKKGSVVIKSGSKIRSQEIGLFASLGKKKIRVFKRPYVAVLSTGNELLNPGRDLVLGKVYDVNTYSLSSQIYDIGGIPISYGIVPDDFVSIRETVIKAIRDSDIIVISGGSSLGKKDFTLDVIDSLKNSEILVHGVSISPGKPTILAKVEKKQIWGLPGHVVSAMIVFKMLVSHFLNKISGMKCDFNFFSIDAILTRNIASAQGRVDYMRVKIKKKGSNFFADPIIGKSGLISNIVKADGLVEIGVNVEGLYKGSLVKVVIF